MKENIQKRLNACLHLLKTNTYNEDELEGMEEISYLLWTKMWRK